MIVDKKKFSQLTSHFRQASIAASASRKLEKQPNKLMMVKNKLLLHILPLSFLA
jgi:hypothetical protein